MKDAGKYRANRIIFDSDSDADTAAADDADVIERAKHDQPDKQVYHATGCLQLPEILEISWNLKFLLEILEISWNLVDAAGKFYS